jgi:hypothetical protein
MLLIQFLFQGAKIQKKIGICKKIRVKFTLVHGYMGTRVLLHGTGTMGQFAFLMYHSRQMAKSPSPQIVLA